MPALAIGAALVAALTWGLSALLMDRAFRTAGPATRVHGQGPGPASANFLRNAFNLVGFGLLWLLGGGGLPSDEVLRALLISGVLGFALGDVLFFSSFRWCGVQTAAMVGLLSVPISVLLSWVWLGESLQPRTLWSMVVVLLGVAIVVTDSSSNSEPGRRPWLGVAICVTSATIWAGAVVLGHDALAGVDVITGGGVRVIGGLLGALVLAAAVGAARPRTSPRREVAHLTAGLHSLPVLRLLLIPSLCASLLNQIPYNLALRDLPGGVAALLFATTPLFTLPLGYFFGERFGMRMIFGTVLGLTGVAGVVLEPGQDPSAPVEITLQVPASADLQVRPLEGPGHEGRWPRLVSDASGGVHLIWTQASNGTDQLLRSVLSDGEWSEPDSLATGESWFVNWADFPALAIGADGRVAAWLQMLGTGTYSYGVRLGWEGGSTWLHSDTSPVEHGFVTLTPLDGGQVFGVWLDARYTLDEEGDLDPTGAMSLFARSLSLDGELGPELCLDDRVCECCQTDVAQLDDGRVLVVWRDRSEEEIRDISWCIGDPRKVGSFSEPKSLHEDGWHIPGCPVNGPSVTSLGGRASVAWFSAGGGESRVLVSSSPVDSGGSLQFAEPVRLDGGHPLGRVDTCPMPDGSLLVTWLEGPEGRGRWCARRVLPGGSLGATLELAEVAGNRGDGFLRLVATERGALGAYQDAEANAPALVEIILAD